MGGKWIMQDNFYKKISPNKQNTFKHFAPQPPYIAVS